MNLKRTAPTLLITGALLLFVLLLNMVVGSVSIPLPTILNLAIKGLANDLSISTDPLATILFRLRIPHALLIAITGAALAGSGAAYQGLFRNPLADPYLIGVASGAGLGAVIAMSFQFPYELYQFFIIPIAAFVGGLVTVLTVYQLARIRKSIPALNLILAGVAVSSFTTAATSFLMLNSVDEVRRAINWMMGGSAMSGWEPVLAILPLAIPGLLILVLMSHSLNVLQFGDEQAQQLGLNVRRSKLWIIIAASVTTAAAVSFTGVIGFIGLIVPHVCRILWGSDFKMLMPVSIITGAIFLLITDILARILMAPQEIPLGIITAMAGAPFFLWLLRKNGLKGGW